MRNRYYRYQNGILRRSVAFVLLSGLILLANISTAATTQDHYYAHDTVVDKHGVIAPWYDMPNGQIDYRVRIAAETMKRYPWTTSDRSIAPLPEYIYSSRWSIDKDGKITVPPIDDWMNGDLGQRAAYVLTGLVDYYRYTGDATAIAHMTYMADYMIEHCQTPSDHEWPDFFISVPTKGKAYYECDPKGHIQLDIVAEAGIGLLQAYQITENQKWFDAAKHWADLFAEKRNTNPGEMPWGRYANPEDTPWQINRQTGGIVFVLYFLDEIIDLGYTGENNEIVETRDAARKYFKEELLPYWTVDETFGINYWDWPSDVQLENVTEFACRYMMDNKDYFPNWKNDVRNVLSLFFNHTSVDTVSNGDVYNGAWAFPESSGCCGRSLWYGPMEIAWPFAQYAKSAESEWAREIARRMIILATYDIHETGYSEDNIDGGQLVNGDWFKIAHPMALKHCLNIIAWMPELFAPAGENHIIYSTAVVSDLRWETDALHYSTYDAPENTFEVLVLASAPENVFAGGELLAKRDDLLANGYMLEHVKGKGALLRVRHDGESDVTVQGMKSHNTAKPVDEIVLEESGEDMEIVFHGDKVHIIGDYSPEGGLAEVYLDGEKQLVGIDSYNSKPRSNQLLYYKNGLKNGKHTLKIVALGEKNPYSKGTKVHIDHCTYDTTECVPTHIGGGGPEGAQRWIFGYPKSDDYKDSNGDFWRPATEWTVRLGHMADSVERAWWTVPVECDIENTEDDEIYRYGAHAPEFIANFTVAPGRYYVRLKFASVREHGTNGEPISVDICGRNVLENLDIAATAGAPGRAVDIVINDVRPKNGIIDIRFYGATYLEGGCVMRPEAFVQAVEIGPGSGGDGDKPVFTKPKESAANLLKNGGFEEGLRGRVGSNNTTHDLTGWAGRFAGENKSYIWPETEFSAHPQWGTPSFHCGYQAVRTHTDGDGHTQIYQEANVGPDTKYMASVWVEAVDLHGKGFGTGDNDSAGLIVRELDKSGKLVLEHPKIEITEATDYTMLTSEFVTSPDTHKVQFILDTVIAAPYQEGHVTYDDCILVEM